jgi:acetyl esterase
MTEMRDESVLDPWVVDWFAANPDFRPLEDFTPELLELARGSLGIPPTREIAQVSDDVVDGVPVRIYQPDRTVTGLVVYFHGGGFAIGSIDLMDNVARELAHTSGAAVVSVGYRLAPENPYPAGLDDCQSVARWAQANAAEFGVSSGHVAVAGESAGGNLAAAVALRLRDSGTPPLAGQVLIYPVVDAEPADHPSREQFAGIVLSRSQMIRYWEMYSAGRDLSDDPYAAPLRAESLKALPPALVLLGGCDPLRDEGRSYAARLRQEGVAVEEVCYAGQPHGFVNLGFPAALQAYEVTGDWLRARFGH